MQSNDSHPIMLRSDPSCLHLINYVLCFTLCRYTPNSDNQYMTFTVTGVQVLKEPYYSCSRYGCRITLHNINVQSSGTYRCEVSGDAPAFHLSYEAANMSVICESSISVPIVFPLNNKKWRSHMTFNVYCFC